MRRLRAARRRPAGAVELQREAAPLVSRQGTQRCPRRVAGVDVSYRGGRARAAAVVLTWPHLELIETASTEGSVRFPYVPGLLAFREVPHLLRALHRLRGPFDVLFVDGQGLAHPRRFGEACHLGVLLDVPALGCAKSRLLGEHREPGTARGRRAALIHKGEVVGTVLRSREGVRPVYVSVGHRLDLRRAASLVLRATPRYRIPEPLRAAHHLAGLWGRPGG